MGEQSERTAGGKTMKISLVILQLVASTAFAQTANVIELAPADTARAQKAWDVLQRAQHDWDMARGELRDQYVLAKWGDPSAGDRSETIGDDRVAWTGSFISGCNTLQIAPSNCVPPPPPTEEERRKAKGWDDAHLRYVRRGFENGFEFYQDFKNLAADKTYTNDNRFKGPVPFIDASAFMPAGGCSEAAISPMTVTATGTSGSHTVTVSDPNFIFKTGCGVMIEGAGPTSSLTTPSSLTVISHVTGGSTTINYKVMACDINEGCSAASTNFALTTSDTWANLTGRHYNFVSWTSHTGDYMNCIYSDKGLGGALVAIGASPIAAFKDMGWVQPVPSFCPVNPSNRATAQSLFTTITAGGGTSTWTIAGTPGTNFSRTLAYHDISSFLTSAALQQNVVVGGSYTGQHAVVLIPPGNYTIGHYPAPGPSTTYLLSGVLGTANLPLDMGIHSNWTGFSSGTGGSFQASHQGIINGSPTTPVVAMGQGFTMEGIGLASVYGTGVFLTQGNGGGATVIKESSLSEVGTQKGCPLLVDGNVIIVYINRTVFTAGTGTDNQTQGSICVSSMTAATSASIALRDSYLVNKTIWMDNPSGNGNLTVNGFILDNVSTENNNENGIINIDKGDARHAALVGGLQVYESSQDNTRNSSNNFRDVWCYNATYPGVTCGAPYFSNSGNVLKEGQSNPPGGGDDYQYGIAASINGGNFYTRNGFLSPEVSNSPNCAASLDLIWGDPFDHRWKMCNNNGTPTDVAGLSDFPSIASVEYCGATSGGTQACTKTVKSTPLIVFGDVTLNTATSQSITKLPFTAATYSCTGSDLTNTAGIVSFNSYANASVTIAESGGGKTDHLRYMCVGY
jgi:hypothetical protein